ncbi:ABC transporter substrate-binding protein [Kitasatospora sp. NBC_01539]|uniref:ABC transporter substrate-binding protein n=1 Tax=Kitasatospora sp. NBC_01539 TaxID=2903577 RepID=UPI0038602017
MTRRALAAAALAGAVLITGCGGSGGTTSGSALPPADAAQVSGDITVLTHRTDLIADGTMKKYADEFTKVYPKVHVTYEGITDYEGEVKIRMNTSNYGDVLLIPAAIAKNDYPKFFAPLGAAADVSGTYDFTAKATVGEQVYGLASFANANGFVYNKSVWAQAGITTWPRTREEFLADLQAIKAKTGSTPYYTNYKDGWPLTAWTSAVGTTGCDTLANDKLAAGDPWAEGSDLRASDTLLYDIVHGKLAEEDPATTNWENSKTQLATGRIATMWLGSWSIVQMQQAAVKAGKDASEIGYMPFPAQKDGAFCSVVAPDYQYAVNVHSAHKPAARAWIDWMLTKSGYADASQAVSAVKGAPMPPTLKPYSDAGVKLVTLSEEKTALVNTIDNAAEIGLQKPDYRQHLIDVARGAASGDLASEFAALSKKWNAARKDAGS